MSFLVFMVAIVSLLAASFLYFIFGTKRPFNYSLKSTASTMAFWVIINSFYLFTGVKVPLSLLSLGVSILCGVPGLLLLIALKTTIL